eukprot:COSAG06_NODE_11036_length_1578_cov_1.714672_1_plen_191_part_00
MNRVPLHSGSGGGGSGRRRQQNIAPLQSDRAAAAVTAAVQQQRQQEQQEDEDLQFAAVGVFWCRGMRGDVLQVRTRRFVSTFIQKTIISPRQARDKYREKTQERTPFTANCIIIDHFSAFEFELVALFLQGVDRRSLHTFTAEAEGDPRYTSRTDPGHTFEVYGFPQGVSVTRWEEGVLLGRWVAAGAGN